jgi:translocation and assembly module TamB
MRWYFAALGLLLVALIAAAAGIGWLVGTEAGLHWAAAKVPGLEVEGLHGKLAGEISAEKLTFKAEGLRISAQKLSLRAHLAALLGGRLTIEPLRAAAIEIDLEAKEQKERRPGPPRLPVRVHIAHARVDLVEVRRGEARYVIREVNLDHASLGEALSLSGAFFWPDARFATRAKLDLRGSLERIDAQLLADVAGVAAEARAVVTPYSPDRLRSIEVRAGPVDLARFDAAAPRTALNAVMKGQMDAAGALSGTIELANGAAGALDAERLPFSHLVATFNTNFTSLSLERMRIALHGGGSVQGEAQLERGKIRGKLVAAAINLRGLHSRLRQTALHGPLQIHVEGEEQWARGSLTQEGIGLTAEVVRVGETLEVHELRALAEGGEVSGTGKVRLSEAMPFDAALTIRNFNPAAFGDYPAGSLSGSVDASGRLGGERRIDAKWKLRDSTLYGHVFHSEGAARVSGMQVSRVDAEVRLGANRLTARGAFGRPGDELAVALDAPRLEEFAPAAGSVRARGTLSGPLDKIRAVASAEADGLILPGGIQFLKAAAKVNGTLAAHELELAAQAPELALEIQARLRGGWTLSRGWTGEIRSLANAGAYPLELVAPAPLKVTPGGVELGRLEARLAEGRVLVREAAWTPSRLASSGEFAGLPAQWLIVAARLTERLSSTMLVDGEWQLIRTKEIQGFVRMRRSSGDLALVGEGLTDLGLGRAVLEARFTNGRAFGSAQIVARVAKAVLQGEITPSLDVRGKVEFAELSTLAGPFVQAGRIDGRLSAELHASGTLFAPVIHGTLAGDGLVYELPLYGLALKDGKLLARLEGESLRLESLSLRGGEGSFTASGTLPLRLAAPAELKWRADKLTVLERPDMRLVVSGEGAASYDGTRASLMGDLRAERGHFEFQRERLPKLGDDVVVIGQSRPPPKTKAKLPVTLDLRLDPGENLVVRGYGYDGKVAGLVDLGTNKEGELRAYGRLHAVHATFLAYGQRLDVDPGVLIFDGPIDNPSLQITAWRRNQAVEAGVQVTGTVRAPIVQLVSQPPVPEGERLSWLVLGRPPSGATQADLGMLQAAAGALLAGGESVPLDRRIARRFGLDELTLRGSGEFTDRVVAVGKRLSNRLYVSYEQGLGAVATNLIKLDYALGRRWTLRAETGTSSGGGLFYRYSWD